VSDRDLVVARALARLPIPDHEPDFWTRLEASLAAEPVADANPFPVADVDEPVPLPAPVDAVVAPQPDPRPEPVPVTELRAGETRRERRQRHRRILTVAAVSIAVIAGASWVISATDETGDGAPPAGSPSSGFGTVTSAPTPTTSAPVTTAVPATTAPPPSATTSPPTAPGQAAAATESVKLFLADLGAGDAAAAASRLGPLSEAYLQSQEPDNPNAVDDFLRQTFEGYGAWSASPDAVYTPIPVRDGEYVVVVRGTVSQEGETAVRAIAVPVRFSASIPDASFIELWAFDPAVGGRLEVLGGQQVPGGPVTVRPNDEIGLSAPADGTAWFTAVDGFGNVLPLTQVPVTAGAEGHTARWTMAVPSAGGSAAVPPVVVMVFENERTFAALTVPIVGA
jgi:hypothetical protein